MLRPRGDLFTMVVHMCELCVFKHTAVKMCQSTAQFIYYRESCKSQEIIYEKPKQQKNVANSCKIDRSVFCGFGARIASSYAEPNRKYYMLSLDICCYCWCVCVCLFLMVQYGCQGVRENRACFSVVISRSPDCGWCLTRNLHEKQNNKFLH